MDNRKKISEKLKNVGDKVLMFFLKYFKYISVNNNLKINNSLMPRNLFNFPRYEKEFVRNSMVFILNSRCYVKCFYLQLLLINFLPLYHQGCVFVYFKIFREVATIVVDVLLIQ